MFGGTGPEKSAGPGGAIRSENWFVGQSGSTPTREKAAIKIQALTRGKFGRDRLKALRRRGLVGGAGDGSRDNMPMANRQSGHPTDRELIGQKMARARNDEVRRHGTGFAESGFDGQSTVVVKTPTQKRTLTQTPAPKGMGGLQECALNGYEDLQLAFEMCDAQKQGKLNRHQAHAFLKALGWLVDDDELDVILYGAHGMPTEGCIDDVWGLKHLVEALSENGKYISKNSDKADFVAALQLLSQGRPRISRNRLVELTAANSPFVKDNLKEILGAALDTGTFRTMLVDDVATKVLTKICVPPATLDKYSLKHA